MNTPSPLPLRRHDPCAQDADELRTVRDLVRHAVSRMSHAQVAFGHGCLDAHDEAVALVLWALHLPPERYEPYADAALSVAEVRQVAQLVEQRVSSRLPLAYLTGEAWLGGLAFKCDARALVPRSLLVEVIGTAPEELLFDQGIDVPPGWPQAILDLCTGAGSLAIHAALRYPQARVLASDISLDALALCSENIALHGLQGAVETHCGDMLAGLGRQHFDLLLCNPPYVPSASMRTLPAEYRAEPVLALEAGEDGMDFLRRFVPKAAHWLSDDGLLLLEIGHESEAFEAAFPALEFTWVEVSAGPDMVVACTRDQLLAALDRAA